MLRCKNINLTVIEKKTWCHTLHRKKIYVTRLRCEIIGVTYHIAKIFTVHRENINVTRCVAKAPDVTCCIAKTSIIKSLQKLMLHVT